MAQTEQILQVIRLARAFFRQRAEMGEEYLFGHVDTWPELSMKTLYESMEACQKCGLGGGRTNLVFGDGDEHADIMFIGEAPGRDEDLQGKPFVGKAGQLLTRIIESIKLGRSEVYITNIVKCRPPGNRDPSPAEIKACLPFLHQQIGMVRPKVICALGRIAAQTLLRTQSPISGLRGKVHIYHPYGSNHGIKLIATFHPAALLRNPQLKRVVWEDVKLLRKEYDGLIIE